MAPDVLGSRTRVVLPSVTGELCMPLEGRRDVGFDGQFKPPAIRDVAWFTKVAAHMEDGWVNWGSFVKGGPAPADWAGSLKAAVLRVRLESVTEAAVRDVAELVSQSIGDWYDRLRDWMEVLTHQDLDHEHPVSSVRVGSVGATPLWVYRDDATRKPDYLVSNQSITVVMAETTPMDRVTWRRAVREANQGTSPPDAHLLLRDSRSSARRGSTRRCVLDAATAVEIALSPLLRTLVGRALNDVAAEALVPDRQNIGTKIPVLAALGISLPGTLHDSVFKVRNRVIHGGYTPSPQEGSKALRDATEVVTAHVAL
jgi:hypothetical protein